MNLSENFTLAQAIKSQTANRLGVDNMPDDQTIERMKLVCEYVLEPVLAHFEKPVVISSFYRSEPVERALNWYGDNQDSPFANWAKKRRLPVVLSTWKKYFALKSHPTGEAVDFEVPGIDNARVAEWVRNNLQFDQIILEFYTPGNPSSGWIHVSYRDGDCRGECLTINKKGTFQGLIA